MRGVDTAYRIDNKHYLFSGNELASYTAGPDGNLPHYMDREPAIVEIGSFGNVRGAFTRNELLYLVGRDSFICSKVDTPEQPLPEYPRSGLAGALVADIRRQFQLPANSSDNIDQCEVHALLLQGSMLLLDTDDVVPGLRVLRLDLSTGILARDFRPFPINWAALRQDGAAFVDLPTARYSFRADKVMKTDRGVPAAWDSNHEVRSISAVWGGRPFDAAIPIDQDLFLFAGASFSRLPRAWAADTLGGTVAAGNIRTALGVRTPIRGSFTNMPAPLLDGFDAALPAASGVYIFKGDHFAHLSGDATLRPVASIKYDVVRLTTSTAARLNRELFTGGVGGLLSLRTQEAPETPGFSGSRSTPDIIRVNTARVNEDTLPLADHLDFGSANGVYLWEIFFHAPALIAGMLSTAQRFEEAKAWYEYIFDPTEPADAWKFLPFLTEDVERIALEIRDRLDRVTARNVDATPLRQILAGEGHLDKLLAMDPAFQGERDLTADEHAELDRLTQLPERLAGPIDGLMAQLDDSDRALCEDLRELVGVASELRGRWKTLQTSRAQVESYLDDPFDPHAIAALRPIAYRKAIVMAYLDNLLDWADMLFGQYTRETIDEARMLYLLAWNVLGRKSGKSGTSHSSPGCRVRRYACRLRSRIRHADAAREPPEGGAEFRGIASANNERGSSRSLISSSPERRAPSNIGRASPTVSSRSGMASISWVCGSRSRSSRRPSTPWPGGGGRQEAGIAGLADAAGARTCRTTVSHSSWPRRSNWRKKWRSSVRNCWPRSRSGTSRRSTGSRPHRKVSSSASRGRCRNRNSPSLQANLVSLQKSRRMRRNVRTRIRIWLDTGLSADGRRPDRVAGHGCRSEHAFGAVQHVLRALCALPAVTAGLFSFGATEEEYEKPAQGIAMALQSAAGAVQGVADILGITAQHERSVQDWTLQRDLAGYDMAQIDAQIQGANCQIRRRNSKSRSRNARSSQNKAVSDFYRSKFTNQELYEWMIAAPFRSSLPDVPACARYGARGRAIVPVRARNPMQTSFIQGQTGIASAKGCCSGYTLGLALDRMDAAFTTSDARRFQITKSISLIEIDPMAFLKLKAERRLRVRPGRSAVRLRFPRPLLPAGQNHRDRPGLRDGTLVNATLTQLSNRVIMEPDPKAVSFLLAPKTHRRHP